VSALDLAACPGLPRDDAGPVFKAPWEAQAFGMALMLYEQGLFTWSEWAAALGREIASAHERGEVDDGPRYYEYWLAALEKLAAGKGLTTFAEMRQRQAEWDQAARATPHGQPIVLHRTRKARQEP
jgi:nitrile hydratase accessory protein